MAKLNYERDVRPLAKKLQSQFKAARGAELSIGASPDDATKWAVYQKWTNGNKDVICEGTLRECYCFLNGMAEFLV